MTTVCSMSFAFPCPRFRSAEKDVGVPTLLVADRTSRPWNTRPVFQDSHKAGES